MTTRNFRSRKKNLGAAFLNEIGKVDREIARLFRFRSVLVEGYASVTCLCAPTGKVGTAGDNGALPRDSGRA